MAHDSPPAASPARSLLLPTWIVAAAYFMEMLDMTVIVPALPMMAESFGVSAVDLSLGLTAYMLALAIFIPASGWVADRFGTRTVFCTAIGVFTAASLLCGTADTLGQFVVLRCLQGIGGAMMSPVGRLVVLHSVEKKDLVRALNLMTAPALFGPVIGPALGGFITTYGSWRWIFFIHVPIGLAGIALGRLFIAQRRDPKRRPFDGGGFALNGLALSCLIYGLDCIGGHGPGVRLGLPLVVAGLGLGWLAVRHARRSDHPLVPLTALRYRTFATANGGGAGMRIGIAGPQFLVPLMLQLGLGMSAFIAGVMVLTHAFGDFAIKAVTTRLLRLTGFRTMLVWSCIAFAAFNAACALFEPSTPYWLLVAVLLAGGIVRSLQMTAQSALQFAEIPRDEFSAASTLANVMQQVLRSIGIAVAAILLNAVAALRGGAAAVTLADFQLTFMLMAAITLSSLVWFLKLPPATAAEVSGHRG